MGDHHEIYSMAFSKMIQEVLMVSVTDLELRKLFYRTSNKYVLYFLPSSHPPFLPDFRYRGWLNHIPQFTAHYHGKAPLLFSSFTSFYLHTHSCFCSSLEATILMCLMCNICLYVLLPNCFELLFWMYLFLIYENATVPSNSILTHMLKRTLRYTQKCVCKCSRQHYL